MSLSSLKANLDSQRTSHICGPYSLLSDTISGPRREGHKSLSVRRNAFVVTEPTLRNEGVGVRPDSWVSLQHGKPGGDESLHIISIGSRLCQKAYLLQEEFHSHRVQQSVRVPWLSPHLSKVSQYLAVGSMWITGCYDWHYPHTFIYYCIQVRKILRLREGYLIILGRESLYNLRSEMIERSRIVEKQN